MSKRKCRLCDKLDVKGTICHACAHGRDKCKCFVCEKQLKHNGCGLDNGTTWTTEGNYGSSVYDNVVDAQVHLSINICDDCLYKKRKLVVEVARVEQVEFKYFEPVLSKPICKT